jgi:MoaA/NifB/PqqE/SkfB family radical SAM enzyme
MPHSFAPILPSPGILGLAPNDLAAPLAVLFELTRKCNLRCAHCFAEAGPEQSGDLSLNEWKTVADQLFALQVPLIFLSGGEPLLFPGFLELAGYLKRRGFYVCLLSNLTLIDEPMADSLAAIGIDKIEGNLDGPTASIYDAFRGVPGAFGKTLRGIKACRDKNLSVRLNVTVTRLNAGCLEEILRLAIELGMKDVAFLPLIQAGRADANFGDLSIPYDEYTATIEPQLKALFRDYQDRANILYEGCAEMMAWGDPAGILPACGAGRIHCTVSPKGRVIPDVYFSDEDVNAVAGDVRKQPFLDIWRESPVLQGMRRMPAGLCADCRDWNCAGGDLYRAYKWHGSLMAGPDPRCNRLSELR